MSAEINRDHQCSSNHRAYGHNNQPMKETRHWQNLYEAPDWYKKN